MDHHCPVLAILETHQLLALLPYHLRHMIAGYTEVCGIVCRSVKLNCTIAPAFTVDQEEMVYAMAEAPFKGLVKMSGLDGEIVCSNCSPDITAWSHECVTMAVADKPKLLFVHDPTATKVLIFNSSDLSLLRKWSEPSFLRGRPDLGYIAYDERYDRLIVTRPYGDGVVAYSLDGKLLCGFGRHGTGNGQLYYPQGVGVDENGLIYVCDRMNRRVCVFTEDGKYVRGWDKAGGVDMLQLCVNQGIVYVNAGSHIDAYSTEGVLLGTFPCQGNRGVVARHGRIYTLDDEEIRVICCNGCTIRS